MRKFVCYTDGSHGGDGLAHGAVVFWGGSPDSSTCVHVTSTDDRLVSMWNVGGELLAAYAAVSAIAGRVQKQNEEKMDTYELELIYDYEGVGKWSRGFWKAKKPGTIWYTKKIKEILEKTPNLKLTFTWVKGHANTAGNVLADKVANYNMIYAKENGIAICDLDSVVKE